MNRNLTPIYVGAAAGFAAALLSVGSVAQNALSIFLFVLSPLPIMIAALGWGPLAGLSAVAVCSASVWMYGGFTAAAMIFLVAAAPAATAAYMAGMARVGEKQYEWFPLSSILLTLALSIAAGFVIIGFLIGYDAEYTRKLSVEMVKMFAEADPQMALNPGFTITASNLTVKLIPFLIPADWTLILLANFWAALHVSRYSGVLQRPMDDFPTSLSMPFIALPIFLLMLAASFFTGSIELLAAPFAGALAVAFTVSGFARFHAATRGKPWRAAALALGYFAVITALFPALFFLIAGLVSSSLNAANAAHTNH